LAHKNKAFLGERAKKGGHKNLVGKKWHSERRRGGKRKRGKRFGVNTMLVRTKGGDRYLDRGVHLGRRIKNV